MVVHLYGRDWPAVLLALFAMTRHRTIGWIEFINFNTRRNLMRCAQHVYDTRSNVGVISRSAYHRSVVRQGWRLIIQKARASRISLSPIPVLKDVEVLWSFLKERTFARS